MTEDTDVDTELAATDTDDIDEVEAGSEATSVSLAEDEVNGSIPDRPVKLGDDDEVRQRIARGLVRRRLRLLALLPCAGRGVVAGLVLTGAVQALVPAALALALARTIGGLRSTPYVRSLGFGGRLDRRAGDR
jgi:ABC-type microcin C transport system permease subunit YejE